MAIFTFFSLFWLQIFINFEFAGFSPKQKYMASTVLQNPDRERTNQRAQICLRLALPYNGKCYVPEDSLHFGPILLTSCPFHCTCQLQFLTAMYKCATFFALHPTCILLAYLNRKFGFYVSWVDPLC